MKKIEKSISTHQYKAMAFMLMLGLNVLAAQERQEQIHFKIDNDKFVFQDHYYTNGIFISYKKLLNNDFVFANKPNNKLQLNFTLGNEIYTPKNTSSFNVDDLDRPYAGWLFGRFEIGLIKQKTALFLTAETGVTGEESLAGKLQTSVHNLLGIDSPTWLEEIAFKWLFNFKAKYVVDWQLGKYHTLHNWVSSSFGNKDIFVESGVSYFFGKFNSLNNSSRLGVIDSTGSKEFYGLIGLGYRYVAHNTLIEGSLFKEDKLFTANSIKYLVKLKAGCVFKNGRNTFSLIYNFNSKETVRSTFHIFGSFVYARTF